MGVFSENAIIGSSAAGDYAIANSLRGGSGNNLQFSGAASNRKTLTFSTWFKRTEGLINHGYDYIFTAGSNSNNYESLGFFPYTGPGVGASLHYQQFISGAAQGYFSTNMSFRDVGAWYHIVFVKDTTNSTAADRLKLYVNGELVDFVSSGTYGYIHLALNQEGYWNNGSNNHYINASIWGGTNSGYLAETHFIDGTALTAASFGETDADTNQWKPIEYEGSYGTNGYYLKYQDSSALGDDSSDNNNDLTVTGYVATDQVLDSPTNNFPTINPLFRSTYTSHTLSEGLLRWYSTSDSMVDASIAIASGKWYWEIFQEANNHNTTYFGIIDTEELYIGAGKVWTIAHINVSAGGDNNTSITKDNTTVQSGLPDLEVGDILGISYDADNLEIDFYVNNVKIGVTQSVTTPPSGYYVPMMLNGNGSGNVKTAIMNFGQDSSFAGNKTAQGNQDGNGKGDFYYAPPTGYLALCTDNLDDPSIADPTAHFNTVTYTGNGTAGNAITGVGFSADFIWIKNRTSTYYHNLADTVRGITKGLNSNATDAENSFSNVQSVQSDGFTVGANPLVNGSSENLVSWNWKARGGTAPSKTYTVTVTNPGSGNRYTLDTRVSGTNAMPITLEEGGTYTFDQSDNSNSGHPLRFSTTANGTHGGGSEYTTGVTTNGTPGSAGAYTRITVAASAPTLYYYCTAHSGMGAEITTPAAGGGVSNLDGTMASVINTNTTSGFSIVKYTGSGVAGDTMGHGLSQTPEMVIMKKRISNGSDGVRGWHVWTKDLTDGYYLSLNGTNAQFSARDFGEVGNGTYPYTAPTASLITFGGVNTGQYQEVNYNGDDYIMYCFNSVEGYSKVGNYTGNGNADGTFVYTGFRPAFIMFKNVTATGNWVIVDSKRNTYNEINKTLWADLTSAEGTYAWGDFTSNGFKFRSTSNGLNNSGQDYTYLAFAESPFKTANAR